MLELGVREDHDYFEHSTEKSCLNSADGNSESNEFYCKSKTTVRKDLFC